MCIKLITFHAMFTYKTFGFLFIIHTFKGGTTNVQKNGMIYGMPKTKVSRKITELIKWPVWKKM